MVINHSKMGGRRGGVRGRGGRRESGVGQRGMGQGLEEEGRSQDRKWTVDVKLKVANGPDIC